MRRPWLAPLLPLYALGAAVRDLRIRRGWEPVRRLRWPVISVGNLSTGGSGKTPLTIALARLLTEKGIHVDVLSRGYGRRSSLAEKVDVAGSAQQFGDEPLLIARATGVPVYVAPQRYDAGMLAETDATTNMNRQHDLVESTATHAHILDDGFQHRQLHRDIDILLLDREDWRDSLLPAGNLREARQAAKRAGILAIPADDPGFEADLRAWGWSGPVWRLHRNMEIQQIDGPVIAFCGIARPEQFFAGLESSGLRLAARKAFRDHHSYTPSDIEGLLATARNCGATAFVTTEKDLIRLGPLAASLPPDLPLIPARLTIEFEDQSAAIDDLIARLRPTSAHSPL